MTTKTTGYEIKLFWEDKEVWKNDAWCDDVVLSVNEKLDLDSSEDIKKIKDTDIVIIQSGYIVQNNRIGTHSTIDLDVAFKKWRKNITQRQIIISIHRDEYEYAKIHLKNIGYTVL